MFKKKKRINLEQNKAPEVKWWFFKIDKTLEKVQSTKKGLSFKEAEARKEKYGENFLPRKKKKTLLDLFIDQLKSYLVLVLLVAVLITLLLGDMVDAVIIALAVIINIIVGFWQEWKTSQALEALQKVVVSHAKVLRDGEEKFLNTSELVPGDVVFLDAGDKVPADIRIFEDRDLKVNEAVLTGESEPADKKTGVVEEKTVLAERENMLYMGTVVTSGSAKGVVVETGERTAIGKIASLVAGIEDEKTPLQKKLDRFAIFLTRIIVMLAVGILLVGVVFGHSLREMFVTAVAVAVSAIPEGLAVTVTVVLAVGMQRILKRKALVRQLLGAEILGSTNVICADKTGTITEGKMRVVKIATVDTSFNLSQGPEQHNTEEAEEQMLALKIGMLCNNAYIAEKKDKLKIDHLVGNLTEKALLLAGVNVGLEKDFLERKFKRLDEIPFSSDKKFMMTLNEEDSEHNIIYLKGAPEKVLLFSNFVYSSKVDKETELNSYYREKFVEMYEQMSKEGLRVLAVGYKKVPVSVKNISGKAEKIAQGEAEIKMTDLYTNFVIVGMVGIKDPIRENVKETLASIKKSGIRPVMITGDNKFTAEVIAKEAGFEISSKNIMEGGDLEDVSETDFVEKVDDIRIYARTSPEQKLRIVKAWQGKGQVVAMTGDGINDAPALKQADVGVALGTATDVAKEASDMVLLNNNFKTIVEAVRQGRIIFENIKKIILYFLSDSFSEIIAILLALIFGWPLPLLASQIIWINLVDDTFPALSLTRDPETHDVMQDKPVKRDSAILNKEYKILILLISLVSAVFVVFTFWFFWQGDSTKVDLARSVSFSALAIYTLMYVFSIRNLAKPVWESRFFSNPVLLISVFVGLALQALAVYNPFLQKFFHTVPLNWWHWLFIFVSGIIVIGFIEAIKWLFNKHYLKNE